MVLKFCSNSLNFAFVWLYCEFMPSKVLCKPSTRSFVASRLEFICKKLPFRVSSLSLSAFSFCVKP